MKDMTITSVEWALVCARAGQRAQGEQRLGQAFFNALYEVAPDLANAIRATIVDPFHRDDRLPAFFRFVTGRIAG